MPTQDEDSEADFRSALRRAGLVISPERYAVMRDAYRGFQALLAALDVPLRDTDEPASVFGLAEKPSR